MFVRAIPRRKAPRTVLVITLLIAACLTITPVVLAASSYQPVEWWTYRNGSPRYGLTYAGLTKGCKQDQPNNWDQKFWININASYNPDSYSIYSFDRTVQSAFSGKSPMGRDLSSIRPYLCLGIWDTARAGGPNNVASKLFAWIR